MPEKSFYDLDYIIEINEQRLEQYNNAYDKVLGRLTNLILIYSTITIFLLPIVQDIFITRTFHWFLYACFSIFAILFIISLVFTIRLIIPAEIAYLESPKKYYEDYRLIYEQTITNQDEIKKLLKASYITELESAWETNELIFTKKSSFYYRALVYGLLSAIPYLICIGSHITQKDDKIQKVQLVNLEKNIKLHSN